MSSIFTYVSGKTFAKNLTRLSGTLQRTCVLWNSFRYAFSYDFAMVNICKTAKKNFIVFSRLSRFINKIRCWSLVTWKQRVVFRRNFLLLYRLWPINFLDNFVSNISKKRYLIIWGFFMLSPFQGDKVEYINAYPNVCKILREAYVLFEKFNGVKPFEVFLSLLEGFEIPAVLSIFFSLIFFY